MTPEGEYEWPDLSDVSGILYELATGLFGSAEDAFPSFQIENLGLLESALALPHQPYYETFADKLAALVRSIACNHALVDGNKRLAVTVLHTALLVNGRLWLWSDEDAANAMLRAAGGDNDFRWLARLIRGFTLPIPDSVLPGLEAMPLGDRIRVVTLTTRLLWDGLIQTWSANPVTRATMPPQSVDEMRRAMIAITTGTEADAPAGLREWFGKLE